MWLGSGIGLGLGLGLGDRVRVSFVHTPGERLPRVTESVHLLAFETDTLILRAAVLRERESGRLSESTLSHQLGSSYFLH